MALWTLHPEQFVAGWSVTGLDRLPFPIRALPRHDDDVALAAESAVLLRAFDVPEYEDYPVAMRLLASAEIYIEVTGTVLGQSVRVAAGCDYNHMVIAREESNDQGALIHLGFGGSGRFAALLIGAVPANAAGQRQFEPVTQPNDPYGEMPQGKVLADVWAQPATPSLEAMYERYGIGAGAIEVFRGPRIGGEERVGRIAWFDLKGDGRYVVGEHGVVCGAGPEYLVEEVDRIVRGELEQIRRERDVAGW